jgi:hypothetical protein
MSYYTEVLVVFIFIVPLIFIAPTPPFNFSVENWVRSVYENIAFAI